MGMIIARRSKKEVSLFKYFFKTLLKVCDPDEVWIASGYFFNGFWNTHDKSGDTLRDLLKGKTVVLVGDKRINKVDIQILKDNLQNDLGPGSVVNSYIHNKPESVLRANDIQLFKNDRVVAGIAGSSSCTTRNLGFLNYKNGTEFDIQTDVVYYDPAFDNDIFIAMSASDSELRNADPASVAIDIFGTDRRPDTEIACDTNLKIFVTKSGLFKEVK